MARQNRTFTIGASPIRIFDAATSAQSTDAFPAMYVTNFFVQMLHAGSGIGYVCLGIPLGITPNVATSGQLTAELAPASANAPGGAFSVNQQSYGSPLSGDVDIARAWIHGGNSGDTVVVSWDSTP